jgi:hypothetical protein
MLILPRSWTRSTAPSVSAEIVAVVFALGPAAFCARIPYKVTVFEDGTCELRGLISRRVLRAQQIISRNPRGYVQGVVQKKAASEGWSWPLS